MPNNISLTIRLPYEINEKLITASKALGMTKTNLIRMAIHELPKDDNIALDFSQNITDKKYRLVLNVNQLTYDILESVCKKYNQSMNAVVVAISYFALELSAKWLQSIKN